jgi:hypothetical protein
LAASAAPLLIACARSSLRGKTAFFPDPRLNVCKLADYIECEVEAQASMKLLRR